MQFNVSFLPAYGAAFILMFARTGTMLMLLPGLGEMSVPARIRLTIALLLTLVMFPLHRGDYGIDLRSPGPVVIALGQELLIGLVLGIAARLTISALQTAGSVVAQQMGLGFVTAVDPTQGQQGMIVGNFLTLLGVTMIFATDMHHLVIAGLHDSYRLFHPGEVPMVSDVSTLVVNTIASAFRVAIQLSGPFLVFGLIFNIALGVLSRLMPQMQVYFVASPLSIMLGFVILLVVVGAMMSGYLSYVGSVLRELAPYSS
jgi:flagellar biosynthetic protein FliR